MDNIKNYDKQLSKRQSTVLFCACIFVPALAAWAVSLLSGMMSDRAMPAPAAPSGMLASLLWVVCSALLGIGLYLALTAESNRERQRVIKHLVVSLFGTLFVLCLAWPFFMYLMRSYALSFVWLLIIDASAIALLAVALRLRPLSGYTVLPFLVFAAFMTYAALHLTIYI